MSRPASATESVQQRFEAATSLFVQGKTIAARQAYVALLTDPATQDPTIRLPILETLLDVCIHSRSAACLRQHAADYVAVANQIKPANDTQLRHLALRVAYYRDQAIFNSSLGNANKVVLDDPAWELEFTADATLYLRRQLLLSNVQLAEDRHVEVERTVNKILSLIASTTNPQEGRLYIACALSDVLSTLLQTGQTERAYGLLMTTGPMIEASLPRTSADYVVFSLTAAELFTEVGELAAALRMLDEATGALAEVELDAEAHETLMARALTSRAVVCAVRGDLVCASQAIQDHPYSRLYSTPGRKPAWFGEVTYLTARGFVRRLEGVSDPTVMAALKEPLGFADSVSVQAVTEIYRAAGAGFAAAAGSNRQGSEAEIGRRLVAAVHAQPRGAFGSWHRPGLVDQILISYAIGAPEDGRSRTDAETAFALFQLAGRSGRSFDADALTVLGQARDGLQRRAIHQALRLRARRDRVEREELQKVAAQALASHGSGAWLQYDTARRRRFRDFAERIAQADRELTKGGVVTSGANLVTLKQFQQKLAPDEAALAVTPVFGQAFAYMCIRRDRTTRSVQPVDMKRVLLDIKVVQAGLTAGHAPSETLDAQFPFEAAARLNAALIAPFEGCLKPGDHIVWLPSPQLISIPLAVLVPQAPPKTGKGYDMAAADWLAKRHAITYAGSASVIVASRSNPRPSADFDFLGIGDPVLDGTGDFASLAPLPETRDELERSAEGFATPRLLMQAEATERRFRGELVGSYRFLSFATHGLLREDLQGLSEPALVLTRASAADATDDGLLTVSEIADLTLSARFVALSACNTANFDLTRFSQDLPALASAFAVAGVPATLATLWPVESETSNRVVAATFEKLRRNDRLAAAQALAQAQRDFLAAPPSKAFLHPRFWSPFIVLGDGGTLAVTIPGHASVAAVDVLPKDADSVLAVQRAGDRVLARVSKGDGGSATYALSAKERGWTVEDAQVSASRLLVDLGGQLLVGGYRKNTAGRGFPGLALLDRADGTVLKSWSDSAFSAYEAIAYSGATTEPGKAVVATPEIGVTPKGQNLALHLMEVDGALVPRRLAKIELPQGVVAPNVTIAAWGEDLLITYSQSHMTLNRAALAGGDDYEQIVCLEPVAWIELRNRRSGALVASRKLPGQIVNANLVDGGETALLGGAVNDCATGSRAVVLSLDKALQTQVLYQDVSLGASEVRALTAMDDGRAFVAASKENVLDYRPSSVAPAASSDDLQSYYSAMLVTLAPGKPASAPKMLDSGSNLYFWTADASRAEDILLGAAMGGQAAIIRLSNAAIR